MRFLYVAISAVILFFPAYWLFQRVVGQDWGAGIAAVFMYVWYPYMALKFLGRNDKKYSEKGMDAALAKGKLSVAEYEVRSYVQIAEFDDEGLLFLLSIAPDRTLCLQGQYLYDVADNKNFPSDKIRIFWDNESGHTFGVEAIGANRLLPLMSLPPLTDKQLSSSGLPRDREIIQLGVEVLVDKIGELS